jgi:hypothetical protein
MNVLVYKPHPTQDYCVRFLVLTLVTMWNRVCWDMIPWIVVDMYQHFGGTCRLCLQARPGVYETPWAMRTSHLDVHFVTYQVLDFQTDNALNNILCIINSGSPSLCAFYIIGVH